MRPPASFTSALRLTTQGRALYHRPTYSLRSSIASRGQLTGIATLRTVHNVAASIGANAVKQIEVGSTLPSVPVKEDAADKPAPLSFPTGKHLIVGVPGAFTGTCNGQIPGYISRFDAFKAKGIEQISVVAVNDVFVLKAWKQSLAPEGTPVRFIADDQGAFSAALGLLFDASPVLGGARSKRYVIVANGDKVETVAVEEVAGQLTVTEASKILALL